MTAPDPADLALLQPPRRGRRVAALGALAVLIGGVAWWVAGRDTTTAWSTEPVKRGSLTRTVTAVGTLEPRVSVEVGSDLTGELVEVTVDDNDPVREGQVLARLDPTPFENALTQAKAQLASSRAKLAQAKVEVERAELARARTDALVTEGAATAAQADEARLDVEAARSAQRAAEATVEQAVAAVERAEQDLAETEILAPMDGVVIQRAVDPGQTVVSSLQATLLFDIASDLTRMQVEVSVDEADVGLVHPGQSATFTVPAFPDRVFEASVSRVALAPEADAAVVSYATQLLVDNHDGALRPGMTATADILVDRLDHVLLVPTLALRFDPPDVEAPRDPHVWSLVDGLPRPVPVAILHSDGLRTAVEATALAEGDALITGSAR